MSQELELRINTRLQDREWLSGRALSNSVYVDAPLLMAAVTRAAQPGLQALQSNVNQIPSRTGRLRRSPILKSKWYGGGSLRGGVSAVALVGYQNDVAPHAYFVEYGARGRSRRGSMPTLAPLARAFEAARPAMENALNAEMQLIADKATSAAR